MGKACFIQGLHNERIQTIVHSRRESILLSQAIEISLKEEGAILSVRENSGAVGPLLRCHKCNKLGHTANKCRSSEKFPHTRAWEVNEFTEVTELTEVTKIMSCFNFGHDGHIAKNCCQGMVCKKCGMKGHIVNNCRVDILQSQPTIILGYNTTNEQFNIHSFHKNGKLISKQSPGSPNPL